MVAYSYICIGKLKMHNYLAVNAWAKCDNLKVLQSWSKFIIICAHYCFLGGQFLPLILNRASTQLYNQDLQMPMILKHMLLCNFKHFWGIAAYSYRLPFLSCVCSTWAPRPSSWLELEPVHTRHSKLSNSSRLVVVVVVASFPGPCVLKYTVRGKPVSESNGGVDKVLQPG